MSENSKLYVGNLPFATTAQDLEALFGEVGTVSVVEIIFDKFVQGASAKTGAGGTGLGLPIARAILRAHGGDIHVEHNEPHGARFVLRIPTPKPRL